MEQYLLVFLIVAVFALQLLVCLKGKTIRIRLLPLLALCAVEALCWIIYYFAQQPWTAFLSGLCAAAVILLIAADGFAWGAYAGVFFFRNRQAKNKPGAI